MRTTTSIAPKAQEEKFTTAISGEAYQKLIRRSVPDAEAAARLTATLISAVGGSQQLQKCKTADILACALRGEGLGLTYGRDYAIVPYGQKATYVQQYKGLLSLLLATGEVADVNVIEVREGELLGRDRRTKRPNFDFSVYATDAEAWEHPVIGYYAYVELLSGYFRFEYMSTEEIIDHADRYVPGFSKATYQKMLNGEITGDELEKLQSGAWYGNTETMMKKTVLRRLLNSGYVPLANNARLNRAMLYDREDGSGIIPELTVGGDAPDTAAEPPQLAQPAPDDAGDEDAVENFFGE